MRRSSMAITSRTLFKNYLGGGRRARSASYCAASCRLAQVSVDDDSTQISMDAWLTLNAELSARKLARESREGSAALGRRFLMLTASASNLPVLGKAAGSAQETGTQLHLAPAFGLAAGAMGIDSRTAAVAYLQQSVTALISGCQRLMALGQSRAQQIRWNLNPAILSAADLGASTPAQQLNSFTVLLDVASARHATLHTRLFIS